MVQSPPRIGRYEVLRLLGEGAMGRVYLAVDPLLKRWVAVKVVRDGVDSPGEFLSRFQREAEISARLNHPNLITVHDVGEDPDLGPYLAMEYVEGATLDQLIAAGPMRTETALDLLIQALEALEATHALGIVHRDLKPSNLLLGKDGRLRLLDFGIAREQDSNRTATAHYLGSPAYAAPELLKSLPATEATDRWSFAVTALELLSGHHPFEAATVGATLYKVAQGAPNFSTVKDPRLQEIFLRALAPDPAERPQDLRLFLLELLEALEFDPAARQGLAARLGRGPGAPPVAREPSPPKKAWVPWVIGLGSAVVAMGLVVLGLNIGAGKRGLAWGWKGPAGRILTIETNPTGAQVWINGAHIGKSPLQHFIQKKGPVAVNVQMEGYWPLERSVGEEEDSVALALNPTPFFVDVLSRPAGAEVYLDGEKQGATPLLRLRVPGPGHRLRLSLAGREDFDALLESGKPLPQPILLEKPRGN